jgi:hypothetical protein
MAWLQAAEEKHWAAWRLLKTDEERELSIQRHDAAISAQREQSDREAWDNHEWEAQNQPPHQQAIIVASSDDDSEGTGSS